MIKKFVRAALGNRDNGQAGTSPVLGTVGAQPVVEAAPKLPFQDQAHSIVSHLQKTTRTLADRIAGATNNDVVLQIYPSVDGLDVVMVRHHGPNSSYPMTLSVVCREYGENNDPCIDLTIRGAGKHMLDTRPIELEARFEMYNTLGVYSTIEASAIEQLSPDEKQKLDLYVWPARYPDHGMR